MVEHLLCSASYSRTAGNLLLSGYNVTLEQTETSK